MSNKTSKPKYTAAERKAYYMGVGAWIGFGKAAGIKKAMGKMSADERRSFGNGFDEAATRRGRKNEK